MTISNTTESAILALTFQSVLWANYATTVGVSSLEANIAVALHTADPGTGATEPGTQATSEATYTSYNRVSVVRSAAGWALTVPAATQIAPVANIDFPAGTGGTDSITFFSTGKASVAFPGTAAILWSGAVSPAITTGSGITPRLTTATRIELD